MIGLEEGRPRWWENHVGRVHPALPGTGAGRGWEGGAHLEGGLRGGWSPTRGRRGQGARRGGTAGRTWLPDPAPASARAGLGPLREADVMGQRCEGGKEGPKAQGREGKEGRRAKGLKPADGRIKGCWDQPLPRSSRGVKGHLWGCLSLSLFKSGARSSYFPLGLATQRLREVPGLDCYPPPSPAPSLRSRLCPLSPRSGRGRLSPHPLLWGPALGPLGLSLRRMP